MEWARPSISLAGGNLNTSSQRPAGLYRRLRRLLAPLHPNRLRARLLHAAHRLGWHHVALWAGGLRPRRLAASWRWLMASHEVARRRRADPRLKVAVDIAPLWEPLTGIGFYLYRLLQHLSDRDDLVLRLYGPAFVDKGDQPPPVVALPSGRAIEVVRWQVPTDFSVVYYHFADFLRRRAAWLIGRDGNDVLFAPNYFLPPPLDRCRGRLVATIHDLSVEKVPETLRESTRDQLRVHLRSTIARATRLITDAEAVRQELIAAGLAPASKIDAIHLAAAGGQGGEPGPLPPGVPERCVLFVGTLEPRKGLATLLAAFPAAAPPGVALVLCGGEGWKAEGLRPMIAAGVDAGWLVRLGYQPDAQLAALYRHAEWLVLPSHYEGFGLPVVEAMAAGVPSLLSDLPVLRELAGEAALYAPAGDVDAWRNLLAAALADAQLRRRLAAASAARAPAFDWRHTAEATARVLHAAAGRSSGALLS